MNQEKLIQIDTELIALLGKRIAVLAELEPPCLDEQSDNLTPLLTQAGVPEFVWKNIVISCVAALATASSHSANIKPRRLTVIGGRGMMGQFFTSRLSAAGHKVNILEENDWDCADRLLAEVDLVLICVPIEHTLDVIRKAVLYLDPTTALADITSIKAPVFRAMLDQHTGPVLSLHPMFGSGIKSFLSQNVVVCPGRQSEAFKWLLELIETEGGKIIVCTPEEHDRMMLIIQTIRHFCAFSLGVFLAQEGIDIGRSLEFSSPPYRLELDLVSRLFTQDVSLHINIMLASEDRRQAISKLANTYSRLAHLVVQKDQAAIKREFEKSYGVFRAGAARALKESDLIIDYLSILLAANEVEQV
ncbi:prephenate dehydrogenase [Tolypothrix sp. NIES-4075]|uniref:prephenate dehydrogenase/arogenate dehydrogenase family protein n=1 Tax=Tolypothrix sp. NIES-4075 TaxID=2005459 RepID=UPI000B5CB739|nr:prephenate dehydrogenase/arogenate dehydrogenase family protein [Tolypothrix sp. NIES-4075]GAX45620.1 prephenate dehydrogenase [Tolypothrix sp. NIES-4075]